MAPVWNQWNFGHNNGMQRNMGSGRLGGSGIPTQPTPTRMMPSQNPWSPISQAPQQSSPWGQMPSSGGQFRTGDEQWFNPANISTGLRQPGTDMWGNRFSYGSGGAGGGDSIGDAGFGSGPRGPMGPLTDLGSMGGLPGNLGSSVGMPDQMGSMPGNGQYQPMQQALLRLFGGGGGGNMPQWNSAPQPSFGGSSFGGTLGNLARRF